MTNNLSRIIHLIPIDGIGGVETATRSMLNGNSNTHGFKLMLIAGKTLSINKLQVIESPFRSPNNPLAHLYTLYKIFSEKPDILVCSLWRTVPIGLLVKLLIPETRLVYFLHYASTTHIFDKLFSQLMLFFCDAVWADSETTLTARLKTHKVTKTLLSRVISFVTSKPIVATKTSNLFSPRFIFWGRLNKQKGLDRAIDLIQILVEKGVNCNFEIWGPDGGELNSLIKQVKNLKIERYIQFMGSFTRENKLADISSSNSFYLQLSRMEGMAMSVVEAMQYGLVPIVTPVGEIERYCKNDLNAIVVHDVDNLDKIAEKIIYLLSNQEKYNALRFSAQKTWSDVPVYRDDFLLAVKELLRLNETR
jgi:glycosyltransferase involved in cell wall biosynthesis